MGHEKNPKNEPFTPFNNSDGNIINLFYNVRFKGTFGQDWTRVYGVERTVWYSFDNPDDNYGYKIQNHASQNFLMPRIRTLVYAKVQAIYRGGIRQKSH